MAAKAVKRPSNLYALVRSDISLLGCRFLGVRTATGLTRCTDWYKSLLLVYVIEMCVKHI